MAEITKILDHTEEAFNRLAEQYKGRVNFESILRSIVYGYDELEDCFFNLDEKRLSIFDAEGEQLDQVGKIIGQERLNFDDAFYRVLLLARIGINVSNGEPERIINTLKLLTRANFVHYMNLRNAEIALGSDGVINPLTVEFLITNLERTVMGGVRVNYLCIYDPDEAFAMDGPNTKSVGKGFGSIYDANAGGKLGSCYTIKKKFSMDGNNASDGGFGTIYDPLVGGVLIGL